MSTNVQKPVNKSSKSKDTGKKEVNIKQTNEVILCEFVFDKHLFQVVDCPTHVKGNILDFIFSNSADRISNIYVHHDQLLSFDHFPISFSIEVILPRSFSTHAFGVVGS